MSMKDFLKAELKLGRDDVFKVDTKNTFSFFNVENNHAELVLQKLNGIKVNDRIVSVEVTENKARDRGRSRNRNRNKSGNALETMVAILEVVSQIQDVAETLNLNALENRLHVQDEADAKAAFNTIKFVNYKV